MAADLESEETCRRSEERVCGSQWPNAPISIVISSDVIPFVSRSLKAYWYISLLSFLTLALWRQSGELYGTVIWNCYCCCLDLVTVVTVGIFGG